MQKNQLVDGKSASILDSAKQLNIGVFTSVPLMQGKLVDWAKNKSDLSAVSPSVGLLQFIRSTPGVLAPLVGQKSDSHVTENLQVMKIDTLSEDNFEKTVKNLTS